jgi:hypothetical protein
VQRMGVTQMLERDGRSVEQYLENLLASNDLEDLDSWMQMISNAEFAAATKNYPRAESLYKLALEFAEQRMSPEVVINSLLCLNTFYQSQGRMLEAEASYARAIALFNDLVIDEH